MAGVSPRATTPAAAPAEPEPSLEQRVATLEHLVKTQTWFIHELMGAVKSMITERAMAQMRPAMEAQARAQIAARLNQGLSPTTSPAATAAETGLRLT